MRQNEKAPDYLFWRVNNWRDIQRPLGCRECDSPEILHPIILLGKLDPVGAESFHRFHLSDNAGGNLSTTLISHHNGGPNQQFPIQVDCSSVFIQVGCFSMRREGTLPMILARQPYSGTQGHPAGAAFRDLIALGGCNH